MGMLARWIENETTQSEFHTIGVLTHPDAEAALRFWADRPADGLMVGRDVPSRAIARLLSHIAIYAPQLDGSDALVHHAGSALLCRFPSDITGMMISDVFAEEEFKVRLAAINRVIDCGEPQFFEVVHHSGGIELLRLELLFLPVMAPNGTDRWALSFAFYF